MKKITAIICVLFTAHLNVFAQKSKPFNYDYEIIYQYTFKPNKADTARLSESTVLFCTDKDFYYTSLRNYQRDRSIANGGGPQQLFELSTGTTKPSKVSHYVFTKKNAIITLERANSRSFSYEEILDLKWKILQDTMNIQGYNCQMASLSYGGRRWLAWFAADIPLSLGPYKFGGLPGLILTIMDDQKQLSWKLATFKNTNTLITWASFYNTRNHESVSKKEYFDYRTNRLKDPFTYDMMLNPSRSNIRSPNLQAVHTAYNIKVKSKLFEDNFIEIE